MNGAGSGVANDSLKSEYAERLQRLSQPAWKRILNVQAPYRWNLRRLEPGYTLDVGCGLGRNLGHLDGHGVGIDANAACVEAVKASGLTAYTPDEFAALPASERRPFDSLLCAHVLEHMPFDQSVALVQSYLGYVKPGGRVILITPQEAGYKSDATHVEFVDSAKLAKAAARLGLQVERNFSFPFPRIAGSVFKYNEFVLVGRLPGAPRA